MSYQIVVKHLEAQAVASIVIPGIRPSAVDAAFHGALPDVFSHLQANAIEPAGPPFARFHDGEGGTVDVEIGIPIPDTTNLPETGTIKARTLPGGEAATTEGSTDDAFLALAEWKAATGRVAAGRLWVSYLDQVRTELVEPLAPPA